MEDKIEVNEYLRTDKGNIGKIVEIRLGFNKDTQLYQDIYILDNGLWTVLDYIVKHSKIISEVVNIGDYVNGREVKHIAMFEGFPDYPKLIFVDETYLIPGESCENDEIKTILTKEQMEANCYKVGGEDEF